MSYTEALLLISLTAIASTAAASFVRYVLHLHLDIRRRLHEVGNPVYLQIGVVFAVLLAFVFNEVWGEYNRAAQAINGECGALHGAAILAHDLSDRQGQGIEQAILNYVQVVIDVEWPALKRREESPQALNAFQAIVEAVGHLNITRPTDLNLQRRILSLVGQAHAYRETRIFQADRGLPMIIWAVLVFYSLVLVVFVLFAGVESRIGHLLFTAVFATSVVLLLILLKMLDYPFEGALTLSNADFVKTIERVSTTMGAV
jgi:hypothetical protein